MFQSKIPTRKDPFFAIVIRFCALPSVQGLFTVFISMLKQYLNLCLSSLIHRRSYVYCEESIITTAASASASSSANNCNNYHHQPISSSSAAAKQSQSIRFAANVAYPLQPTISGQQQQQQSIPVMANYYHHNHHAHLQQPNKSPQIISHQFKQSNGQSQYYVPIIKNSNQSQQHLHPDSHGQVYLGHDIDELDKQQQRLATQHHYYQQPAQSDNMLISESFNANDPLHHHHHYQTCAQQACYYHQKSSSSSSPSVRHHSNVAPPQSDNYATTMIIDPYYPNLAKKNSPSIMIDTDNDYCNYPTQHFIHSSNSNSNSNSNQQKSTTIPTTSCSHHHNHHHHHHHAANSSKASSSTGSCNSTTTYQSRSSSTNQPHSQPKRSQTTVKGQTQPPSTKQTNKINWSICIMVLNSPAIKASFALFMECNGHIVSWFCFALDSIGNIIRSLILIWLIWILIFANPDFSLDDGSLLIDWLMSRQPTTILQNSFPNVLFEFAFVFI